MPLFLTPGQFSRHAEFYRQIGQLTLAGMQLTRALEHLSRHPPARSYRAPIAKAVKAIDGGSTFGQAVASSEGWLPAFDLALLKAGEQSGRLDSAFLLLAAYYEDRASVSRQLLADLAYPVFLLHAAVFILPFSDFFLSGDWVAYLGTIAMVLVPIYLLVFLGIYAAQSRHGEGWRAFIEMATNWIPVLGKARRELAVSRLATSLDALLGAGVTVIEAWELAAAACGSPRLRRAVAGWIPLMQAGDTPAEVIQRSSVLPEVFTAQYATGEVSGQLDDTLSRLHTYYHQEGTRKLHALAQWTPRLVYLIIAGVLAYKIITFWQNYYGGLSSVLEM